tara:strand:+ start:721 stop:1044 length:324 start_codon:yes stop_codon:yes gene_type:complete
MSQAPAMEEQQPREEGNILDMVFGDGGKNPDESSPLKTVQSFFNTFLAFGAVDFVLGEGADILSKGLDGGVDIEIVAQVQPSVENTLTNGIDMTLNSLTSGPGGMGS